ncbi:MAG: hypothetical protein LAN64_08240 [Acidobacteriia bacterium]|nr:hypothetical protein [Terriglobia bacterium]
MPNYDPVINKLLDKTEAGTLPWKPTFDEDTFIVALEGEVTFEVSRVEDGGFAFSMKDKDGKKIIDMTSHKREQYHQDYVPDDGYFEKISRLFEAARVTALEVEKKLNDAQSLLDKF